MSECRSGTASVLLAGVNVALAVFGVLPLLGSATALVAALAMALCPWTVAWAREAPFYSLQQSLYLVTVLAFWRLCEAAGARRVAGIAVVCASAYFLSILTSFHSILFLGGIGAYAILRMPEGRRLKSRWTVLVAGSGAAAGLPSGGLPPPLDLL